MQSYTDLFLSKLVEQAVPHRVSTLQNLANANSVLYISEKNMPIFTLRLELEATQPTLGVVHAVDRKRPHRRGDWWGGNRNHQRKKLPMVCR